MGNYVSLTFKDTNSAITFDLNKNTLFFGNNGRGKTRVLKTIESLYKLLHHSNPNEVYNLIDKMYLKELTVGNFDCIDLFKNSDSIKSQNLKQLNRFIKRNRIEFKKIYTEMNSFRNSIAHGHGNKYSRLYPLKFLDILKKTILKLHKICNPNLVSNIFSSVTEFEQFFIELELLIDEVVSLNKRSDYYEISNNRELFESNISVDINYIQFTFHHLKSRYNTDVLFNSNNIKEELDKIEVTRKRIVEFLKSKTVYYITTDNADINLTIEKINSVVFSINNDLQNWLWNKKDKNLEKVLLKQNELLIKLQSFNEIMGKYGDIEIRVGVNSTLNFYKENRKVPFEKLSSGERKISYLFLEILFNDVDVYLIDEPELSISLNYQNKLVIDLHTLTKGKSLFIATHAPFIYEDFKIIEGNIVKEVN